jgi:hypothetical protein
MPGSPVFQQSELRRCAPILQFCRFRAGGSSQPRLHFKQCCRAGAARSRIILTELKSDAAPTAPNVKSTGTVFQKLPKLNDFIVFSISIYNNFQFFGLLYSRVGARAGAASKFFAKSQSHVEMMRLRDTDF